MVFLMELVAPIVRELFVNNILVLGLFVLIVDPQYQVIVIVIVINLSLETLLFVNLRLTN